MGCVRRTELVEKFLVYVSSNTNEKSTLLVKAGNTYEH